MLRQRERERERERKRERERERERDKSEIRYQFFSNVLIIPSIIFSSREKYEINSFIEVFSKA